MARFKQRGGQLVQFTPEEEAQADADEIADVARNAAYIQAKADRLAELEEIPASDNSIVALKAKVNLLLEAVKRLEGLE